MTLFDNYQINQKICTDHHNFTYYSAIRLADRLPVIIKTINSQLFTANSTDWLKNEYKILQRADLSGIINAYSLENNRNSLALILENFEGEFLERFIDNHRVAIEDFLVIAIQLTETLQKLHQNGIIHQNIEPSSIVINPKNLEVKITNFRIATNFMRETKISPPPLEALNIAYISPEQTGRTNLPLDYRTDFYSLGIIFYKMLTERLTCDGEESLQLMHCHLAKIPVAPHQIDSEIPPAVSSIVMKLLAKNPDDRYQSAYGIKSDLETCLTQYQTRGKIELFDLGKSDKRSRLVITSKLYGRASAIASLASSLERVYSGATEVVLVSGQSGLGKTSLIQTVTQLKVKQKGFLITGKFDSLQANTPYIGIIQAFRGLMSQFLTKSPDFLQVWREKILSAIANNGKIITDIIPELELIIGSQPDIPQLPAKETENRFNNVFVKFVRVFIGAEHPLILFLDDLQWADTASLNLLGLLLNNLDSQYLSIIWAYRNDEIGEASSGNNKVFVDFVNFTSLLTHTLEKIPQQIVVSKIVLEPLSLNDIQGLVVDTLDCSESQALPLAELLFERTWGNPFLVHQLLQSFYQEEVLTFDFESFSWQWSLEEIRATSISNYSILKLVEKNLAKLPEQSQKVLKVAACIGNQFDLETLAIANNQSEAQIVEELEQILQAGIIFVPKEQDNSVYQFVHNRVSHTVYSLLEEREKASIHLKIGQYLLSSTPPNARESKIFNLVYHFNIGRELLSQGLLTNRIAELNLVAGRKAKKAIAYEVAENYLNIALELLPASAWRDNYDLIFNVYTEAIEVQYLCTNFERSEYLADIAFGLARTIPERVKISKLKIHGYIARDRMDLAIDTGLSALELLNVYLPHQSEENQDLKTLLTKKRNSLKSLENLPLMSDSLAMAAMEILAIMVPPVYIVKPQLFPSIVLQAIAISLEYGNCRFSAFAYSLYALLLCVAGEIDEGYRLGKLALTLHKNLDAPDLKSKVTFIFNNTIRHWKEPAIWTLDYFLEGIQDGIEVGDVEHACFHAKYYCTYLFFVGKPLAAAEEKLREQINLIQNFKQDFQLNYARIWQQLNFNLQGLAEEPLLLMGESFDECKMLPVWQSTNNATSLLGLYLAKLILCYFLQDYPQAFAIAECGKQYLPAASGTMCYSEYYFYAALARLAVCSPQTEIPAASLSEIVSNQKQLKQWADCAPDNYLNKYYLVTAEIARISGNNEQAAKNYDRAIALGTKVGFIHEAALAAELTAKFYLSRGRTKIAEYYLTDAYDEYFRWGAMAKLQALKSRYPQLLTRIPTQELTTQELTTQELPASNIHPVKLVEVPNQSNSVERLDFLSVIKASQAISSEIILDNLLSKMMEIVMENSGARKTTLLLKENSSWVIAASATTIPEIAVHVSAIPVAEYLELPNSIINYIQSTRNTVILEQASQEGIFTDDPYIVKYQPQSVLACPMIYQNELQGIICLENNLVRGVFTPQKLEILQVLLSQVSISIENARLYKELADHASVQKSLKQKETLLKEIHHRVKNNLLVASSILGFQSSYIEDPKMIKILENCQNRITSMALVHQHLYGNRNLNTINFAEYIESLLDNLADSQAIEDRNINIVTNLDNIELNIETANPCGLIINELVSNALEHGFANRDSGNIQLSLKQSLEGQISLIIQDDGIGFKEDLDLYNSDSLGLELVCTLVEQLDGEIELDKTKGTKITITFKELNYTERF